MNRGGGQDRLDEGITRLLMIARRHISDAGSTPAASTTCGGVPVSTGCCEREGGSAAGDYRDRLGEGESPLHRANSANHKRQRSFVRAAAGCLASSGAFRCARQQEHRSNAGAMKAPERIP